MGRASEKYHAAPPVLFDDFLKLDLDPGLRTAIDELLEAKKRTTEKEENTQMPVIKRYKNKRLSQMNLRMIITEIGVLWIRYL